ncbi:MAG TPA: hypothetical protein VH743_09430 [Beijerinckiaceae bacterium]|jgi:hypothetical protein
MRRPVLALLTILALAAPAPAAEPDSAEIAELKAIARKTQPTRDAWERCMATYAKGRITTTKIPAAEIADKALAACTTRERRLREVLAGEIGAARAGNVATALREIHRSNLIAAIEQLRRKRAAE